MNSAFPDSDLSPDEIPTNELEPLAVTDEGWDDSNLKENNRPDVTGVALTDVPEKQQRILRIMQPLSWIPWR